MKNIAFGQDQVKEVNRIYHDFEADIYAEYHPEIAYEKAAWERIGKTYLVQERQITLVDVGTGTGFVPSVVGKFLKEGDAVICSDISERMLSKAEEGLTRYQQIQKTFVRADALALSKMGLKADCITMNSVLHHLPDYEEVLLNLAGSVKEKGLFIIMHERNRRFCRNVPLLQGQCLLLVRIKMTARRVAGKVLVALGLYRRSTEREKLYERVREAVRQQGICEGNLSTEEINALVDIHDPDEGGEGFDPFLLHDKFFKDFEIVELFTHKHLGPWVGTKGRALETRLLRFLEKKYPYSGSVFGLIMRKKESKQDSLA